MYAIQKEDDSLLKWQNLTTLFTKFDIFVDLLLSSRKNLDQLSLYEAIEDILPFAYKGPYMYYVLQVGSRRAQWAKIMVYSTLIR